jgi:hypothetical protein
MGREIRMVPPNWQHPKGERNGEENYLPMYDQDAQSKIEEWITNYRSWKKEEHDGYEYWEYEGGLHPEYYRPKFTEEPTWYQVYETVSEGTPITPPFATKEELVNYLVEFGDFWQQHKWKKRFTDIWCHGAEEPGWNRKSAEQFVECEWAPSAWNIEKGAAAVEVANMQKSGKIAGKMTLAQYQKLADGAE